MKKSLVKGLALVSVSVLGVTGLSLAPANATLANKTLIVQEGNTLSGLNTAIPRKNLVTNADVLYPTGAGFTYYNNKSQLVRNTNFGTFKIGKNECKTASTTDEFGCFSVLYTVKKGLKYSDGTLITAQDLLLSHAISSSDYSIKAGLGDPNSDDGSKFNSAGYGGAYDDHTRAESFALSADNFTLEVKYDAYQPDWQNFGPGPGAVHALAAMANGEETLLSPRENAGYKAAFESAYYTAIKPLPASTSKAYAKALKARTAARELMSDMAEVWSNDWNITTVNADTNPLLLISNGGFMIESCGPSSCRLVKNPNGNLGGAPKQTGNIEVMLFKFPASGTTFSDAAVAQALKNGEVDLYSGSATTTFMGTVTGATNLVVQNGNTATYEHLDLRTGPASEQNEGSGNSLCSGKTTYDGPWAGNSQRSKDLRKAFLLVVPRQVIANTYIGKVFDGSFTGNSPVLNSLFSLTTEPDYAKVVAGSKSFVDQFTQDQDARNAQALALVRKYYPTAGLNTNNITVKYLASTAARRVDIRTQIELQAAKIGFKVEATHTTSWPDWLTCNDYDVYDFAWSRSAILQTGSNSQYQSTGGNNSTGWNDEAMDAELKKFESALTPTQIPTTKISAERVLWSNYWTLPLYQWPGISAWNKDLKGVLPSPLNPNVVWNYWQLSF